MLRSLLFWFLISFFLHFPTTSTVYSYDISYHGEAIPIIREEEKPIGTLFIPRIHLKQSFYSKDSLENTIEKHVSILKESPPPSYENSLFLLAAHSGEGEVAYFEELNQLEIGDSVEITYEGVAYSYLIDSIWEEEKTGYIHVPSGEGRQLILTTCSPGKKNTQLIIYCIEDI
ncbi:MAG: sortase [Bacilli bacterium]|nr:sortase [Bacilli bacterium]